MADEPKLVVALEARLDRFEKQLREAGLIAQKQMREIEDTTTNVFKGTLAGNLISKAFISAMDSAKASITAAIEEMKNLGHAAKMTGLNFEEIQRIGSATRVSGVSDSAFITGLEGAGAKMDEMNRRENDLSKLLDANNVKYKDRNGLVVDVNRGLELAATLMARAGSEFEKVEIARIFGLTADWVKVLGKGVDEFRKMKDAAKIDPDLEKSVRAAAALAQMATEVSAEFRRWGTSIATYAIGPLAAATEILAEFAKAVAAAGKEGVAPDFLNEAAKRLERINEIVQRVRTEMNTPRITVNRPSGVNWKEEADDAESFMKKAQDALSKRNELAQAELATVGMTAQKQEEARQLALLTEAARRDELDPATAITEEMRKQVALAGQLQQAIAQRQAQVQELAGWSKEFGSAMSDAMKGMVLQAKKFDEVLKTMADRLAGKAFDKLFDVIFASPAGGGSSAFLKLFGLASGGPAMAGQPYIVGERGPELFVPNRSGQVIPNTSMMRAGGGAAVTVSNVTPITIEGSADARTIGMMQAMLEQRDRRFVADVAHATAELRRRSAFA